MDKIGLTRSSQIDRIAKLRLAASALRPRNFSSKLWRSATHQPTFFVDLFGSSKSFYSYYIITDDRGTIFKQSMWESERTFFCKKCPLRRATVTGGFFF